jgi:hypothetical protein
MSGIKVVYKINNENKYIGIIILDDTDISPNGNWNIPSNCIDGVEPLKPKAGFDVIWKGDKWEYKEVPKEPSEPEPTLDELKASKISEMKAEHNIREQQIIEYNGNTFDYDDLARERLLLGRQSLEDAGVEDAKLKWTCADNEITYLGIEDFKGINTVAATRSIMLHDTYNKLKVLINSCGTKEELEKVTFDTDVSMLSYGE